MAYILFTANQFIPYRNYVTINGSEPIRVQNGAYKVDRGSYHVVVHGAGGTAWECEGSVNSSSACLSIRLAQDQEGNITNISYAVFDLNSKQELVYGSTAQKLKLEYKASSVDVSDSSADGLLEKSERIETSGRASSESGSTPNNTSKPKFRDGKLIGWGLGLTVLFGAGILACFGGMIEMQNMFVYIGGAAIGLIVLIKGLVG